MNFKVRRNSAAAQKPKVLALLPQSAIAQLNSALGDCLGEIRCLIDDELIESTDNLDALFVDPGILECTTSGASKLRKAEAVPCVGFVTLDARNVHSVLNFSNPGLTTCFVYPLERNESERLRHFVETLHARKLWTRFLAMLEPSVGRLPASLLAAILNMFERPSRYYCASDLALQAHVDRRSLYRNFDAVHVGSPRKLLVVARIIHAYAYLRQQALTVHQVAAKVGYERVETLVEHCEEILGCVPSHLRAEVAEDEVLKHLLEWYSKPSMSSKELKLSSNILS
ncbi:MAG TPA: helix-turn-helix domain-containing protein [Gemmatimonadaceae bacterium]|jgi:AraC-like DNA-binding protein|nr:helix-turn-helix domain-containing protein [Gemmatimonadaceae bacterium]